jgi:signal peptidase II
MPRLKIGPWFTAGILAAVATLAADQLSKTLVLRLLDWKVGEPLALAPFLDFVLTLNRGISYGLFPQDSDAGRWFLILLKIAVAVVFLVWMAQTTNRLVALGLGLLIGGALGNAIDRVLYGAVIDFVSLHAYGWYWYVFNLADTAVVAGVIALLYDALFADATKSPGSGRT